MEIRPAQNGLPQRKADEYTEKVWINDIEPGETGRKLSDKFKIIK